MNEVVNKLRHEATRNELAKAVFVMWGVRDRARAMVSVPNLMASMTKHNFQFSKDKYQAFLEFLGDLGFGRIHRDVHGRVTALTGISFKLQSIARAALGEDAAFKTLKRRARFRDIHKAGVEAPKPILKKEPEVIPKVIGLTVLLGDHKLNVQVADLSSAEISVLMSVFESASQKIKAAS